MTIVVIFIHRRKNSACLTNMWFLKCPVVSMGCLVTPQTAHIRVQEKYHEQVFWDEKTSRSVLVRDNVNQGRQTVQL